MSGDNPLLDRLRRNAGSGTATPTVPATSSRPTYDADLVPDFDDDSGPQQDTAMDAVLDGIDIIEAYSRWCGKMVPKVGSKRESIMISCPNPEHEDKEPSAWINLDKQTWCCGGCGMDGGDKYDLAARHFGFPIPGYKSGAMFPDLRRRMAEDLGYQVIKAPSGREFVVAPEPAEPEPSPAKAPLTIVPSEDPIELPTAKSEFEDFLDKVPPIDWQNILPMDTFLWRWMNVTTKWDYPDEYMFWLGMMAVGCAGGDDVVLVDQPDIEPNLYVCLYGPSGIGKSRASKVLIDQLKTTLPYDQTDPYSTGIHIAPTPGSGETLLDIFSKTDDDDPTRPMPVQVRGLVRFDELASLTGRASRMGSTLKPTIISLYDGVGINTRSRATGVINVENPFCQMLSTTQPRAIRNLLTSEDADSGFVNRWIFAAGRPKKLIAYGRDPFDPMILDPALKRIRAWASTKRPMRLRGDALARWERFFSDVIEPMKLSLDADPLIGRIDLTLLKIILLLTINDMASEPSRAHVEAAIGLWPYLDSSYTMLSGEIGIGVIDDCANAVLAAVAQFHEPTLRDIYVNRLKSRYSREVVLKAVNQLVALDQIEEIMSQAKRGPRTVRYRVAATA